MRIIIKQKYFAIGNKFQICDDNDNVVFLAMRSWDSIRNNIELFTAQDSFVLRMQAKVRNMFSTYFDVSDAFGQKVFSISESIPIFGLRRAKTLGNIDIKIKCGPVHLKAYMRGENGKYDKKNPIVKAQKKVLKIADTYVVDVDDTRISKEYGTAIGIWYDLVAHNKSH